MPLRKDYLLDQLRDFFAALNRIAARIEAGELERVEEEIDALASSAAIGELLQASDGSVVTDAVYAGWKFQVQLLLLKIRVLEARGVAGGRLPEAGMGVALEAVRLVRMQAVEALRKLIGLRPGVYDMELAEQLRGLEKS